MKSWQKIKAGYSDNINALTALNLIPAAAWYDGLDQMDFYPSKRPNVFSDFAQKWSKYVRCCTYSQKNDLLIRILVGTCGKMQL